MLSKRAIEGTRRPRAAISRRMERTLCGFGKASRKLDAPGAIFGQEPISIPNEQIRVEEVVGILVRIQRRRFGAAKVNPLLIPRDDRVDRWVLPGAQTLEAKFVLVVGRVDGRSVVKNWGAIWRIMALRLPPRP